MKTNRTESTFRERSSRADMEDISGYLTKEETLILQNISFRVASPYRKKTYTQWICKNGHSFFYKVNKCPACDTEKVEEKVTKINLNNSEESIQNRMLNSQKAPKIVIQNHVPRKSATKRLLRK